MEFRIAQITDDPHGVLTGAFVFSPPPVLPDVPRVLVERFDGENTRLGLHGWAVDSKGLRPRLIEKRGAELWLCFGAEVSFHVLPNTPVRVTIPGSDIEGIEIWPPIPRGKAPPLPPAGIDDEWPPLGKPEPKPQPAPAPKPEPKPEPAPPPRPVEEPTVIVPQVRDELPPPPPPPPPLPVDPEAGTDDGSDLGTDTGTETGGSRLPLIAGALAVLLLLGGGAAWWLLQEPAAPPPPPRTAEVAPAPVAPECAEAADVLSGRCPPDRLRALPPAEQTRLAEALLGMGDPRAGNLGVGLLSIAANGHNHGPARMALARLYDPANFRPGGPLSAANPGRALEEYGRAAEAGLAEARTAREALVARLRQAATGSDPAAAEQARSALAAAGLQ